MSADLFEAFNQEDATGSPENKGAQSTFNFLDSTDEPQWHNSKSSKTTRVEPIFQPSSSGGNDVLFDASEEATAEEDDFGDFEEVHDHATPPRPATKAQHPTSAAKVATTPTFMSSQRPAASNEATMFDLLSLDEPTAQKIPQPQMRFDTAPPASHVYDRTDPTLSTSQTIPEAQPSVVEPHDELEGWGDFESFQTAQPANSTPMPPRYKAHPPAPLQATSGMTSRSILRALQPKTPPVPTTHEDDKWDPSEDGNLIATSPDPAAATHQTHSGPPNSTSSIPPDAQRPTNIPPPTILLSLLPTTFQSLVTLILSDPTTSNLTHHAPTAGLSDQVATAFRVAARLISTPARTLRWRRDTLLSQSTRIGIAGKSGGMKLSSLNKGETVKEEREGAEAVEAWNCKIHLVSKVLKSAGPGSGGPTTLRLSMNLPVKPLTGPGIIQAALVCPLCGLKRSERLVGVDDVGVQDVFGEYWLENWGHKECAEWWYRWKAELSQR